MPIPATNPTTVNGLTFDKWAFTFATFGDGLADFGSSTMRPIGALAYLIKYRDRPDGVSERSPLASDSVAVTIDDLYALAATNATVAAAIQALISAVVDQATLQGKI